MQQLEQPSYVWLIQYPSGQGIKTMGLHAYLIATSTSRGHAIDAGTPIAKDHLDISTRTSRLSEGSCAEGKTGIGRYSKQLDMARTLLGNGVTCVGLVNIVVGSGQEQMPEGRD